MATTTRILDANVNGTVYTSNANSALEALDTCHSGAVAPTDEVANGKLWLDTSTTPGILKIYNNATWEVVQHGADVTVTGAFTSLGIDDNATSTAMTIDASENVLVGKTALDNTTAGHNFYASGFTSHVRDGGDVVILNRLSSDGNIAVFRKDGTTVGTIGTRYSDLMLGTAATGLRFYDQVNAVTPWNMTANDTKDGVISLGQSGDRFKDLYLEGGLRGDTLTFSNLASTEAMRIDSSGNVLVGKTVSSSATAGVAVFSSGYLATTVTQGTANVGSVAQFRRNSTDGSIVDFYKDGTTVGNIRTYSSALAIGDNTTYMAFDSGATPAFIPSTGLANRDNAVDLGDLTARFDDIFATNGTIQTSDRNEKQDIDVLSAAETAVAQACKGLLRKFRWKDAVAEKGDDARIHFGIIAQDLQDAFAAQGLDAGRYAMFISGTWWEADRIIPAVEAVAAQDAVYEDVIIPAVLDEEGNEIEAERVEQQLVSEAVEAVEAVAEQTVTDTFETLEEAPEGATERTRLGVRYPELLAFIIAAM